MSEKAVQLNLPGTCRSDKKARPPKRLEGALQQQTRAVLSGIGYASMETGKGRKQVACPRCDHRFFPKGWQGNTPGFPDLTILRYHDSFPAVGVLVEMKGEDTPVEAEQQALADAGRTVIARSIEEAVRAVLAAELAMDAYRLSPQRRQLLERFLAENAGKLH